MNIQRINEANANNASSNYWNQWGRAEIRSMQGIDSSEYKESYHKESYYEDKIAEGEVEHLCSELCMECLGLSWADFL